MSAVRQELPSDHVPEVPAPFEHRGPEPKIIADNGILYLVDDEDIHNRYFAYDGPISEVTR